MSRLEFITHKKRLELYAHFFWNISVYTKLMLVCSDLQRCIIAPWNSPKRQSLAKLHALHFTKNHKTSNDMWNQAHMSLTQYVVYFLRVPGGILVTDGPLPYSNSISVQYIHIGIRMKYLWLKLAEISEASTSSCCLVGLPLPPLWLSCHSHEAQCSCHLLLVAIPMVCHGK